jgi:lipopolysaccharide/colanic/teichoic acid biosynthesis glycosyltransferase
LFLKRPFDVALSSLGLLLSTPLWAAIPAAVWLEDRGPVFYAQERVGRNGRTFKALKFRSMVKDAESGSGPVQAVARDPRVTKVGRILRATAMDELPQLVNIFKGDMSFVGPRALRPNEREANGGAGTVALADIPGYEARHAVRPGLTGLTQVFLPGETPRRRKFRYDLLYIRERSFWLDLKLIALSFWITFRGKWESREPKV